MERTYRYPFPPYPDGWYLLCPSVAVETGATTIVGPPPFAVTPR